MKIVINADFGGFGLSGWATQELGLSKYPFSDDLRINQGLIELIEKVGSEKVSGPYSVLKIVEIPDNLKYWEIRDYDGLESVVASESPILHFR